MALVIIFSIVTLLCAVGTLRSLKDKNLLAAGIAGLSFLTFGWFSVMTAIAIMNGHGVPVPH